MSRPRCRAKDPVKCRIHGVETVQPVVESADAYLTRRLAEDTAYSVAMDAVYGMVESHMKPAMVSLRTSLSAYPEYLSDKFQQRVEQFRQRLALSYPELVALGANHVSGNPLTVEDTRAILSHHVSPVIGWLHIDGSELIPNYKSSDIYASVQNLRTQLDACCAKTAVLLNQTPAR